MKNWKMPLLALCAGLTFHSCQKDNDVLSETTGQATDRSAITIPAGSVDALQEALDNNTTVILAPGLHIETGTVTVSGLKHIVGQPGSVLRVTTDYVPYGQTLTLDPALHFLDAPNATIAGVKIESASTIGNASILLENSGSASVSRCVITGFQFGIIAEQSDGCKIAKCNVVVSTAWQTGAISDAYGITIVNAENAVVEDNTVSGAIFGIWPCDKNGVCRKNTTTGNFIGIILCKVPQAFFLPDGNLTGAEFACKSWTVRNNNSFGNQWGYIVIDGANNNLVENNTASSNGVYDYELVGDSYRFGFLTPYSFENTVKVANNNTVKDCGVDNTVIGGIVIDTNLFPCN